ncbi:hypothetical protein BH09DEP1_BH09DEP1_6320 [soil metagenome]
MQKILLCLSIFASIHVACKLPTGNHITLKEIHNQSVMEYILDPQVSIAFNKILNDQTKDAYKEWDYYKSFAKEALNNVLPEDLKQIINSMRVNNYPTAHLLFITCLLIQRFHLLLKMALDHQCQLKIMERGMQVNQAY